MAPRNRSIEPGTLDTRPKLSSRKPARKQTQLALASLERWERHAPSV
jgi:hypothetical protein